uniref:Uncharacterized protein n=1 Tax=Fagus sylvatica TaxID=28930 RepID=A0A2N9GLJ3_FAGSY
MTAMQKEMSSMDKNNVWELVDLPPGRKTIGNKWVLKVKRKADGSIDRYKARLVAKSYSQREGIDYEDTFSPVVRFASIRLILSIVAKQALELFQMDVKTAFLNGELDEEIYMGQPAGFEVQGHERKVCYLKHSIYGLKQSSMQWYLRFHDSITSLDFEMIEEDHCVYLKRSRRSILILLLYVDDILLARNDMDSIVTTKKWLSFTFEMNDMGEANFVLRVKITRDRSKKLLSLTQGTYINKIVERYRKGVRTNLERLSSRLKSENLRGSSECPEYHQHHDAHPLWWWKMRVPPESLLERHTGLLGTLGNHRGSLMKSRQEGLQYYPHHNSPHHNSPHHNNPHHNIPTLTKCRLGRQMKEPHQEGLVQINRTEGIIGASESRSPTPLTVPRKSLNLGKPSRSRPPFYGEKSSPMKKHLSRRTTCPGRQNAIWKAFDLISSSPFSKDIEKAKMPERYPAPRFEIYNGRTDPVTHIGHYHQSMALSRNNDPLMCRLFSSNLGEVAMRWFNQLGTRTIYSWDQMAEAFVAQFITNSRKRKEMSTLLTMKLEDNETLKDYSTRFWETYNDIEACGEEVAITTFKMGLPTDSGLRQSLVKHPPRDLGKLMYKIDQFVRIEEDGRRTPPVQTMAQPKVTITKPAARTGNTTKNLSAPKNFVAPTFRAFKTVFKEPIYKIMEKIKREPFFVWPPKMLGNPALKDGNLYCSYHREKGHMTENCHLLKVHLEKLVSARHLDRYINVDLFDKKEPGQEARQPHPSGTPSTGIIHVIHNPLCPAVSSASHRSKMQKAAHLRKSFSIPDSAHLAPMYSVSRGDLEQMISFSDSDLRDVQLPHNDPLVVTLRIGNYDFQRVLIDQGSFAEVMYQDLYEKLGLDEAELSSFTTPIFGFSGEPTMSLGKTELPILAGDPVYPPLEVEISYTSRSHGVEWGSGRRKAMCFGGHQMEGYSRGSEHRPIVQKQRKLAPERATIILEEVERLLASGAIREVQYPVWLSNMVVVKKKNGKWRVCIDFTDLNKACPKDPFPLPRIDQLVDSASRHARLSFLDAFQGYHQIPMNPADQEKTTFITPRGTTVEVYIDDMLVKSLREENHLVDLLQVFDILRESHLRLNAPKCTFGVSSGKFLGHVVSRRGIEANPDQIAALIDLSADKCKPFFRLLGKRSKFVWDEKCLAAFQAIKTYLSTPPCLSIPNPGEPLFLYLAVSDHVVSAVLIRELGQEQKPIFFVSKAMDETELRYLPLEKAVLALLHVAKKLPHYFQSSTVTVLRIVLISPEGLVLKQAVRLKFSASNNEAEYEAMLISLKTAKKLGAKHLQIFCDSQLVANQISGEYQARDDRMLAYLAAARTLLAEFNSTHIAQIEREHNSHVDILAKLATALESDIQRTVCIETLDQPSFQDQEVSVYSVSSQPSWMDPILSYLKDNKLPEDKKEAKMIKRKAPRYWVSQEGLLYRRLFTGPYLLCAEVSNKVILNGIKRKLEAAKGKWVEELPSILWTYRTTVRKSTNETPFALAFGVEAVIPLEIEMPTIRTTEFDVQTNEDNLCKDLDLVEERRDLAMVRLAAYQQRIKREHNKNVKPRTFQIGDLVLRKVMANTRKPNEGKLGPNWEGPYKVLSQAGHGAYRLENLDGKPIPRPWNTCNLRKYFF